MTICPRCEQGLLELVKISRCELTIKKCAECDAVWGAAVDPSRETFIQYQLLLDVLGESEIEIPYEVLREL
ncbi:hypothetical protein AB0B66_07760 [Catellatospora sp. NPDC049111]|uniref:hypothetical protein n=1 Tax=Catellatospora sp. NPDC049111 TaxID=3155271 RepID=UPI0033C726AD